MVGPLCITHLVNFDWATKLDKIRSIMGMLFKFGSSVISCNNKLQPIVALSMMKAKILFNNEYDKRDYIVKCSFNGVWLFKRSAYTFL